MGIYEFLDTDFGFAAAMFCVGLFMVGFEFLAGVVLKVVYWMKGKE